MTSLFSLKNQVALITGSSRGIGRSIAATMASLGAKVVISSRKIDACEAVADELRKQGVDAIALACNVSRRPEIEALADATVKHYGRIDILVCNAATNPVMGPLRDLSDEAFDKILATNLKSNLWISNRVFPGMAERGGGSAIFISSVAAFQATEVLGAYGISKAADIMLARNLALEWGPRKVRVNCIAPGLIKTDFARALWENPAILEHRNQRTPLRRIGLPEEVGGVAAFLASPAASFITGEVIVVDGGATIA